VGKQGGMASRIRIRIDDVLKESSAWGGNRGPEERFAQVCRWVSQADVDFVPTILCLDIQRYPSTIEAIKHSTLSGRMAPAIHGWEHIDYNSLSEIDIRSHLKKCMDWFHDYLWYEPTVWCTPWGAESEKLTAVASEFKLIVEGTGAQVEPGKWLEKARGGILYPNIMWHWWERGQKLLKVVQVIKYGSYDSAVENREDLFNAR